MGGQQSAQDQQPANDAAAPSYGNAGTSAMGSNTKAANNKVQLAVSVLGGVQIPGFTAYHSSVMVNGEEFFFSDAGISWVCLWADVPDSLKFCRPFLAWNVVVNSHHSTNYGPILVRLRSILARLSTIPVHI